MEKSNNAIINYVLEGGNNAEEAIKFVKTDFDKVLYNYAFGRNADKFDVKFSVEKEFEKGGEYGKKAKVKTNCNRKSNQWNGKGFHHKQA